MVFDFRRRIERFVDPEWKLKKLAKEEEKRRAEEKVKIDKFTKKELREILKKREEKRWERLAKTEWALRRRITEFRPPPETDFSFQENVLRQTFGRGDHIWGHRMRPVDLNFDLNARQRGQPGDDETAKMFGFG